jgi:hypothetical protein
MEQKKNPYEGLKLTEGIIREAMENSQSNKAAARYLNISYKSYKKYANKFIDESTGKTLFQLHLNEQGFRIKKSNEFPKKGKTVLETMLRRDQKVTDERLIRLRRMLTRTNKLKLMCSACGYDQKRTLDDRVPLVLHFVDEDKTNWEIENLEYYCYNCAFHYGLPTLMKPSKIRHIVTNNTINSEEITKEDYQQFYDLDEMYYEHLKNLGLDGTGDLKVHDEKDLVDFEEDDGSEFIDTVV